MCSVCGCGHGEARIEGLGAHPHDHAHQHEHADPHQHEHAHTHADGTTHSHPHGHDHAPSHHRHDHTHDHEHDHDHAHAGHHRHRHEPAARPEPVTSLAGPEDRATRLLTVERDILARNDATAAANRRGFQTAGVLALNLVSSPGSGKTTLLVETLRRIRSEFPLAVIEGDQETSADADRIRAAGAPAIQINTGKGCHLDADMVRGGIGRLGMPAGGVLFIENVGNLVCPAGFDLGEAHKVVIVSVTEGEDKPIKYPNMFAASTVMVVTKTDLLPHLDFDVDQLIGNARRINPAIGVLKLSAKSGDGMDRWINWIAAARALRLATE